MPAVPPRGNGSVAQITTVEAGLLREPGEVLHPALPLHRPRSAPRLASSSPYSFALSLHPPAFLSHGLRRALQDVLPNLYVFPCIQHQQHKPPACHAFCAPHKAQTRRQHEVAIYFFRSLLRICSHTNTSTTMAGIDLRSLGCFLLLVLAFSYASFRSGCQAQLLSRSVEQIHRKWKKNCRESSQHRYHNLPFLSEN